VAGGPGRPTRARRTTSHGTTGSEATGPNSSGCAGHGDIGQATAIHRQRHGQIGDDFPGSRTARPASSFQRGRKAPSSPVAHSVCASSTLPGLRHDPRPSADTAILACGQVRAGGPGKSPEATLAIGARLIEFTR
jgi:hypothetical protein